MDLVRLGAPSARFTCKRPEIHGHRNTNYSNKLYFRLTCIITDVEIDEKEYAEEYFTYASYKNICCYSVYSTIITMNNLLPRDNTILLLSRAQPSFPYNRYNSTDSTAVAYTLTWRTARQISPSPKLPPCTVRSISKRSVHSHGTR